MKKKEKIKELNGIISEQEAIIAKLREENEALLRIKDYSIEEWEPFDADRWSPDRVVKTIDGRDVRVLCTDLSSPLYTVAAHTPQDDTGIFLHSFTKDGKFRIDREDSRDLMMLKLPSNNKPHSS